jgi:hypothetical protein
VNILGQKTPDSFETSGTLLINGGRLKQTLRMTSVGNQTVVYEDRVTALANLTVRSERGVPLGIENDGITGGTRIVSCQDGKTVFDWRNTRQATGLSGPWVNVDGRLGVIAVAGAGMAYVQATKYTPGISVYSDVLYGSYSSQVRRFKAGDEVAHRLAVFLWKSRPRRLKNWRNPAKLR